VAMAPTGLWHGGTGHASEVVLSRSAPGTSRR
jgi:hypothetical protein